MNGSNLALKWGLKDVELKTDSATVVGWVKTVLSNDKRVRKKWAPEMVIKQHLGLLRDLLNEFGATLQATFVSTHTNKTNGLTRVRKEWIKFEKDAPNGSNICCSSLDIAEVHNKHHMGIDRTLHIARKIDPIITKGGGKESSQLL